MKVVGTFDPNILYSQRKTAKQDSSFAAMLAFNLDKKPGEQDITALFGSNNSDLERLYEEMTGKTLDSEAENKTVVFTFWNRTTTTGYWAGEFLDKSDNAFEEWLIPDRSVPSSQNVRHAIR